MSPSLSPVWVSLKVTLCASAAVLVIGTLLAWRLAMWRWRGKAVLETILTLPLVLPPTAVGYYLLLILGRGTAFGEWLNAMGIRLILTWQGAAIAAAVMAAPLMVKSAQTAMEGVDTEMQEAARTLGAGEWTIFWYVLLPLSYRGLLAGAALSFARALSEFGATLMVAGNIPGRTQTAPIALYTAVQAGRDGEAAAYAVLLTVIAFAMLWLVSFYQRRLSAARS
ncbi:MAG: molybdate ABC transporter permease subunit [Armatimonadetes bacterium]|nr:molybdate ABC transporter permease subunit [Armatimonadota bacterium]